MENPNFLKNKYNLHNAPETEAAAKRTEARSRLLRQPADSASQAGEKVPQDPEARIQNYLARFTEIIERKEPAKRERGIEALKHMLHDKFVIKEENIPQSYYNLQGEIAVNEGRKQDLINAGVRIEIKKIKNKAGEEIEKRDFIFPADIRKQHAQMAIANQQRSMDKWIDYLASDDARYPDWAKYWTFRSMLEMGKLRKQEDKDGKERAMFAKRTGDTVSSFPPLNPRALALTIGTLREQQAEKAKPKEDRKPIGNKSVKLDSKEFQNLISTENFSKIYAQFLIEMPEYSTEGLQETRGKWVKYRQNSNPTELVKSLEGYPLEWCTADYDTAQTHLQGGDFYVYYSVNDDGEAVIPRLAVRMEGNRIAEPPRGIAPDQNMDPYIIPVLEEKLKDFGPEGEAFRKRSADMKRLTEIDNKTKQGKQLTKGDLVFLYEIDSKIEDFGYQRDPRIEELRKTRKPKEDALIVFECASGEIAWKKEDIRENTKAYVGELEPGIFNVLPEKVEHVYTKFPDEKIQFRNIVLGSGPKSAGEFNKAIKAGGHEIGSWAEDILKKIKFENIKEETEYELVILTVASLGFKNGATTEEIRDRAIELGLELSPAEVGPELRLQYKKENQPKGEYLLIGMEPITDSDGDPYVFYVGRGGGGRSWLDADIGHPARGWGAGSQWGFVRRKPLKS